MRKTMVRFVALLTIAATTAQLSAQDKDGDAQSAATTQPAATCPVSGQPISLDHWARFRGKRVYFCCDDCREKFRDEPYEYTDGVTAQWKAMRPLRAQVTCPVTGEPALPNIFVERKTDDVYFATQDAKKAWLAGPKKYENKLESCYVFQTTCAVCENDIRGNVSEKVDGREVYFCCPGCRSSFDSDRTPWVEAVDKEIKANRKEWLRRHPPKEIHKHDMPKKP